MILCTDLSAPLEASCPDHNGLHPADAPRDPRALMNWHDEVRRQYCRCRALAKSTAIMRRDASGNVTEVEPSTVGSNGWQDSLSHKPNRSGFGKPKASLAVSVLFGTQVPLWQPSL